VTREENLPDASDVDEQGKKHTPRSDQGRGRESEDGESEVDEHGYRFPREHGRPQHPEASESEASEHSIRVKGADDDPTVEESGARESG
jgi:hypothetical protein